MSGTYSSSDWDAIGSMLAGYFACVAIFVVAIIALMIVVYWRILQKAGYNGAWSLLVLVPGLGGFASLGILLFLAFAEWPALRGPARVAPYAPPPVRYPTNPPPGSAAYSAPPGQTQAGYTPPTYVPPPAPTAPPQQAPGMAPGMAPVAPPMAPAPMPPIVPPAEPVTPPAEPAMAPESPMMPGPTMAPEQPSGPAMMPEPPTAEPPKMEPAPGEPPMSPEPPEEPTGPVV